jgi:hypothetical protein
MGSLNVRVDAETAALVERIARQSGRTKSEVVRQALAALGEHGKRTSTRTPAEAMAHLIGCWDSGGMRLSERTGERFAALLREKQHAHRTGRRRPTSRAD